MNKYLKTWNCDSKEKFSDDIECLPKYGEQHFEIKARFAPLKIRKPLLKTWFEAQLNIITFLFPQVLKGKTDENS